MRICYATFGYPIGGGGISSYVYYIAHALAAQGHEIHIVLLTDQAESTKEDDDGVTIHRCALPRLLHKTLALPVVAHGLRSAVLGRKIHQLERAGPLLVEFPDHGAFGLVFNHRFRHPSSRVIVKLHTTSKLSSLKGNLPSSMSLEAVDLVERLCIARAHGLSAPTQAIAQLTSDHYNLSRPISVVPYPIDLQFWSPARAENRSGNSEQPLIVYAGRFEERKGVDLLLDAMERVWEQHPDARLVMVGSTMQGQGQAVYRKRVEDKIQLLASKYALEVHGWLSRTALRDLYRRASVAVVPSLYESFGFACLEPIACGTPVVASDVGGIPSVVGRAEEGGVLVSAENAPAFAAAICQLIADPNTLAQRQQQARQRAIDHFSYDTIAPKTIAAYKQFSA